MLSKSEKQFVNDVLDEAYLAYLSDKNYISFRLLDVLTSIDKKNISDTEFKSLFINIYNTGFVTLVNESDINEFNINGYNGFTFNNFGLYNLKTYASYINYLSEVKAKEIDKSWSRASVLIAVGALVVSIVQFCTQEPKIDELQKKLNDIEASHKHPLLKELKSKKELYQVDTLNNKGHKKTK